LTSAKQKVFLVMDKITIAYLTNFYGNIAMEPKPNKRSGHRKWRKREEGRLRREALAEEIIVVPDPEVQKVTDKLPPAPKKAAKKPAPKKKKSE